MIFYNSNKGVRNVDSCFNIYNKEYKCLFPQLKKREGDISTEVAVQLLHTNQTILTNTRDNNGMHKQIG